MGKGFGAVGRLTRLTPLRKGATNSPTRAFFSETLNKITYLHFLGDPISKEHDQFFSFDLDAK
jgi:hypothetical protein